MGLQFSGHESFICKHFWLKKGYDFIRENGSFGDESSVVGLGVGKNMVLSISFWLKAFGINNQLAQTSDLANYLFEPVMGKDQFIENTGTIWLLHYSLIKTDKASIYNIFFNQFRKGRTEFTKEQLAAFLSRRAQGEEKNNVNIKTITADISVFIRNYLKPDYKGSKVDIEDDFSGVLLDLELMKSYQSENAEGKIVEWYRVNNSDKIDLPYQIVLFAILDNKSFGKSIPFKDLMTSPNSPGSVFLLTEESLYKKIQQITSRYKKIVFTETAGIRELQIKSELNKWSILDDYYQ